MKVFLSLIALLLLGATWFFGGQNQEQEKEEEFGGEPCPLSREACFALKKSVYKQLAWDGIRVDGLGAGQAIKVIEVEPGSPGAESGVKVGDILVAMDDKPLETITNNQLIAIMRALKVGSTVTYLVDRKGERLLIPVTMAGTPDELIEKWLEKHMKYAHGPDKKQ